MILNPSCSSIVNSIPISGIKEIKTLLKKFCDKTKCKIAIIEYVNDPSKTTPLLFGNDTEYCHIAYDVDINKLKLNNGKLGFPSSLVYNEEIKEKFCYTLCRVSLYRNDVNCHLDISYDYRKLLIICNDDSDEQYSMLSDIIDMFGDSLESDGGSIETFYEWCEDQKKNDV